MNEVTITKPNIPDAFWSIVANKPVAEPHLLPESASQEKINQTIAAILSSFIDKDSQQIPASYTDSGPEKR